MSMEYTSHFAPPVPPHKPKPLPSSIGEERSLKCVLLEDGVVGKTRLLVSYTTYGYPTRYIPTAFYDFSALVKVRNTPIKLQFCDTAGQDEFDKLRHFCYPKTDVVILCFIEVSPSSFQNISERWISEIETHCSNVLLVLVGTQYNCTVLEED